MNIKDVGDFANYEVYEKQAGVYHCICICEGIDEACLIARLLAKEDPNGDSYYVSGVVVPGTFVPGGGWHHEFRRGDDGQVRMSSLM